MEKLNQIDSERIKKEITPIYGSCLSLYDTNKYPEDIYNQALDEFSKKVVRNIQIENAMKWKWGHWGKNNYPQHHKSLIDIISNIWPRYVNSDCQSPLDTFEFWRRNLEKPQRYISVAFITHLIHSEVVKVIDQHNYRAMNHLLSIVGRDVKKKKKPSNWSDIEDLGIFLESMSKVLDKEIREVDKFLMMYGRYYAPR